MRDRRTSGPVRNRGGRTFGARGGSGAVDSFASGAVGRTVQLVQRITDSNFEAEVLASDVPVVIDFWAETCVPCRLQEPTINRLARELEGRAKVGRLDVYDNPRTTEAMNVRGVPHLAVIRNGEVILEMVGGHSFDQLRARLRSIDLP